MAPLHAAAQGQAPNDGRPPPSPPLVPAPVPLHPAYGQPLPPLKLPAAFPYGGGAVAAAAAAAVRGWLRFGDRSLASSLR